MVLLLACVNLGNLILAKNAARSREIAIRAAIGADRSRLIRQLLTESALLSFLGGAVGIAVAAWGIELLSQARPFSFTDASPIRIDMRILLFTLCSSIGTTLLFGLTPAFTVARGSLNEALGSAGRTTGGLARVRGRTALAIGEIAVALALLIGAGLMIRSASRLAGVDPGFRSTNVLLAADLVLPDTRYGADETLRAFGRASVASVSAVPGVTGAALTNSPPLAGRNTSGDFKIEGRPEWEPGKQPLAQYRVITPGYLRLLSIPVRRGRGFTDADRENSVPVALINDAFAKRFFSGTDPIGARLQVEWGTDTAWRTIVGVVAGVRGERLDTAPMPEIYFPFAQHPVENPIVLLATTQRPEKMLGPVRNAVWSIDRDLPLGALVPMSQIIAGSYARRRFSTVLLTLFGFAALLIASLGSTASSLSSSRSGARRSASASRSVRNARTSSA
jgi:putative ABC transport system permease protein